MKRLLQIFLILTIVVFFGGCSTVFNTTTQDVEIKSEPAYAKITVDGKKFGTTPQVVNLERGSNHVIKLELDGYELYESQVTRKISTAVWFNVLNGVIPGILIDMFTGSMYNLLPEAIQIELQPAKIVPEKKRR